MKNEGTQYYFLAGLPRTGNTVLSALLNQNPNIYSSPLSPINSYLWEMEKINSASEVSQFVNQEGALYAGQQVIKNYYNKINKPVIMDREKSWATPANFNLIKKYITLTPKIIFTYRPVVEILASFIKILPENSYIDKNMEMEGWWSKPYLSKNDNRCDYLMRPHGQIDRIAMSWGEINNAKNKETFCLINYNDLINKPNETLKNIYSFLQLSNYQHNISNIKNENEPNYVIDDKPTGFHDIRKKLKKESIEPKQILSEYVINKYSNIGYTLL
jgi:sulfotransferase